MATVNSEAPDKKQRSLEQKGRSMYLEFASSRKTALNEAAGLPGVSRVVPREVDKVSFEPRQL